MNRVWRRIARMLLLALAVIGAEVIRAAQPFAAEPAATDRQFLEALRARRLFWLIERFCAEKLASAALSERDRATLSVELSSARTEQALQTPESEEATAWQRATEVADVYAAQHAASPYLPLVRVQDAAVHLARAEQLRERAEVLRSAENATQWDAARLEARAAIAVLQSALEQIEAQLRALAEVASGTLMNRDDLLVLQRNARFALAGAYRVQGQCYPAGSADRVAALEQCAEMLRPLAEGDPADSMTRRAHLDQVACFRLLGDGGRAERLLATLEREQAPRDIQAGVRAERIRMALAARRFDEAIQLSTLPQDELASADLDFAILEALVAAWHAANDARRADDAAQWQAKANAQLVRIDSRYGPYWSRRGEGLLATTVSQSPAGNDVTVLIRAAEGFYRAGQKSEAIATYDRAAEQSAVAGDAAKAFELGYTAAAIAQSRENYAEAAARYRRLALELPRHPQAAAAHLLAIYNASRVIHPDDPESARTYEALLTEHLNEWPSDPTTAQARLWLGKLRQAERRWADAVAAYRGVPLETASFTAALDAIEPCWNAWIEQTQAARQPIEPMTVEAASYFENVITRGQGALPQQWTTEQRRAALAAARLWLRFVPAQADRAERILAAALAASAEAPADWRRQAAASLVVAQATQQHFDEARGALRSALAGATPDELLSLVESLTTLVETLPIERRANLAMLALEAGESIQTAGSLAPEQRARLQRDHALLLALAGRSDEALAELETLTKQRPRDAIVLRQFAELLSERTDGASLGKALSAWRRLEQGFKAGSPEWFQAKYEIAACHERMGEPQRAAEVAAVTQLLHPDFGGNEMKQRFLALIERCAQRDPLP